MENIRKQVYDLTLEDFEEYPVWEFCLDEETQEGQDEATVKPFGLTSPLELGGPLVVIKADFTLADGTEMKGYIYPPMSMLRDDVGDLGYIQPNIITRGGQVGFWYGVTEPDSEELSKNYELLGKTPLEIFPLEYRSTVDREDGLVEGVLVGFTYRKKGFLGRMKTCIIK